MRVSLAICLLLAVLVAPAWADEPNAVAVPLTLKQYVQALDDSLATVHEINSTAQAEEFLRSLPPSWHVEVDSRSFDISTEPIRSGLQSWQKKPDQASLEPVTEYLETLRSEAAGDDTAMSDFSSRRTLLNNILSRREFHNVHGQTWMDLLKQKVTDLLIKLLGKAFRSSMIPAISNILVYGLIVIAVLAVPYWMYRSLRESAYLETIMPVVMPVSAKQWPVWMSEARSAAERGAWRDAIHLAYWAGISFLEAQGSWRPDLARTPREYLRLLPSTSPNQPALRGLTMRLEGVWYGMHPAGAEAFEQTVAELERLGCPCR